MTKIEWCDETLNPLGWGCYGPGGTPESPKICPYCYAKRMAHRGVRDCDLCRQFIPHLHQEQFNRPYGWKKPRRIFWQSMGDLFHPYTPEYLIRHVLKAAQDTPRHTHISLTKNPKRLKDFNPWPANCWVGTTVTNQTDADERLPELLKVDAPVRFVSHEPLLGKIYVGYSENGERLVGFLPGLSRINWAIIGAQTGPGAVKPQPDWVMNLAQQYRDAGVPFFIKDNLGFKDQPQEFPA